MPDRQTSHTPGPEMVSEERIRELEINPGPYAPGQGRARMGEIRQMARELLAHREANSNHVAIARALRLLVADVAQYEAWQRPCYALDVARAALAKAGD